MNDSDCNCTERAETPELEFSVEEKPKKKYRKSVRFNLEEARMMNFLPVKNKMRPSILKKPFEGGSSSSSFDDDDMSSVENEMDTSRQIYFYPTLAAGA